MVGGQPSALETARPVLEVISARIFHCGESGAGHTAKLLNNFLNAVSLAATAEVMVAGKKAGLDLAVLLDVINLSSGVNYATQNRFPKIIKGDYLQAAGSSNTLMLKDVILYTELLGQLGVAGLNAAAARRELRPRPRARLRRPDQQHRGRRPRRHIRRRPALRQGDLAS